VLRDSKAKGPLRVAGRGHYRLAADHDGIACES
jgi:hypothetical protein